MASKDIGIVDGVVIRQIEREGDVPLVSVNGTCWPARTWAGLFVEQAIAVGLSEAWWTAHRDELVELLVNADLISADQAAEATRYVLTCPFELDRMPMAPAINPEALAAMGFKWPTKAE